VADERADEAKARAQLVSMLAHELRGPITTIRSIAATSRAHFDRLSDDEKIEFLGLIEQESGRMLDVVDQAALAMRLAAGGLAAASGPTELAAIAGQGIEEAALGGRTIELELDEVPVDADRTMLIQVVRQLVRNADAYSPPEEPITVRVRREGDHAVLEVVDRGPGVPEDRREALFGMFPNWRPAGYEEVPGTGLGLFISRAVVAEHHGEISIEGEQDGGTMLRVRLPAGETTDG
jgi:signal transduction histidine kinase